MATRLAWNERVLIIKSEAVRREAVGCIAWLGIYGENLSCEFLLVLSGECSVCLRLVVWKMLPLPPLKDSELRWSFFL